MSGLLCFILEKDWYFHLHRLLKIPLYSILGISVAFALTFSVIDLVNYVIGFLQGDTLARPWVESQNQISLVLAV